MTDTSYPNIESAATWRSIRNSLLAAILAIVLMLCTLTVLTSNQIYLARRRFTTITGKASRVDIISLGKWKYAAIAGCFAFLFFAIILPLFTQLLGATIDIWGKGYFLGNLTLRHFKAVIFELEDFKRSILNVFSLGVSADAVAVVIGMVISYYIIRSRKATSRALNLVAFIPFVIPGIVIGIGLILSFARPPLVLYGTMWILLVGYVIRFLPIVTSSGTAAFRQIDEELEDAGRIFGTSWIKTQIKVLFPILKDPPSEKKNVLKGKIKERTFTGNNIDYRVTVKEEIFRVQVFDTEILHQIQEQVYLWINPDKVTVLSE